MNNTEIIQNLKQCKSLKEANDILNNLNLKANELRSLGKEIGIPIYGKNKSQLTESIVYSTIGYKIYFDIVMNIPL